MRIFHCTLAILALAVAGSTAQAPAAGTADSGYTTFLRGVPIGHEDVTLRTTADGVVVNSRGSLGPPLSAVFRDVEVRYAPDGAPRSFTLDGSLNGEEVVLRTRFANGSATTDGAQAGKPVSVTVPVSADTIVLPSGMFAGFAALPARLAKAAVGDEFPTFILPSSEIRGRVLNISGERMQRSTSLVEVRRYDIALTEAGGAVLVQVTTSSAGELLRVNVPSQALDFVRDDFAGATSRTDIYSNRGDQPVNIPAPGFNVGATMTLPPDAAAAKLAVGAKRPAIVLVPSPEAGDRDSLAPGVPGFGQLAGALADSGYVVVRYDRRGSGQSGGRAESAVLGDYADDVRTVVKWLSERKDIDAKRIAVIGHDTGAWIAMLAASREKRIAATLTIAAPASPGIDFALEQQQIQLDRMKLPAAERDAKVALQKQIDTAVLTGKGWERIPAELRRQADTPWFQSLLAFDPAKIADDVEPLLIVHGALDREVPVAHAERLASLARKGDAAVKVVTVPGVNHVMQPAMTGDIDEYQELAGKGVSPQVVSSIVGWLGQTLPARTR